MQRELRILVLRDDSGTKAEAAVSTSEPDREALARSRAARRSRRDQTSGRFEVMGNDAGWYRTR